MLKPIKISRNQSRGSWSVCLHHEESGRDYWVDVYLNEKYHDPEIDWNQYVFYLADVDDIERKGFQENCDNFDEACSEAICILEHENEIFQGEDGDWYICGDKVDGIWNEEWKGVHTWTI